MDIKKTLEELITNYGIFFWPKADKMDHREIHLGSRFESQIIFALDENKGIALIERYLTTEDENSKVLSNLKYSSATKEYELIKELISIIEPDPYSYFQDEGFDDVLKIYQTTEFINKNFDS